MTRRLHFRNVGLAFRQRGIKGLGGLPVSPGQPCSRFPHCRRAAARCFERWLVPGQFHPKLESATHRLGRSDRRRAATLPEECPPRRRRLQCERLRPRQRRRGRRTFPEAYALTHSKRGCPPLAAKECGPIAQLRVRSAPMWKERRRVRRQELRNIRECPKA